MFMVPVTATGVSERSVASRVLGTTLTHSLSLAIIASISASGTSRLSLIVSAWLWQRIAAREAAAEDLVRLGAALPLFEAGAVAAIGVDPGDQAATERDTEVRRLLFRHRALAIDDPFVDFEDRRLRVVEESLHLGVERTVLREQ